MTATELDDVALVLDALNEFPEACRKKAVLVVHTDPNIRVQVKLDLDRRGYRVFTAGSGLDAVWVALNYAYDLDVLVCGADLPDLPAMELYSRLKVNISGLRCCVLTPDLTWADELAAVRMGAGVVHTTTAFTP